jgi:uncharacterized protein (DUF433 family)
MAATDAGIPTLGVFGYRQTMDITADSIAILGKGAYTVADASRLSRVSPTKIRRWLGGRSRWYRGEVVYDAPLWTAALPVIDDGLYLGFRDLIELRMVDRFRRQHLSMPYLRKVVVAAQELVGDSHPFSTSHFKTDGRRLYLEMLSRTREPKLIEVLSGQHVFHSIIAEGLEDVSFEDGVAALWRPEAGRGEEALDPRRSFGQPILHRYGVPTAAIARQVKAGRTPAQIATDFELDDRAVRAALTFESRLAA